METFRVLSAFYIKERNQLLIAVEGRDDRFRRGAMLIDSLGRQYRVEALTELTALPEDKKALITSMLVSGGRDMGRLIRFLEK